MHVELVGVLVALRVAVGRRVPQRDLVAGLDLRAVELQVLRRGAAEVRERREHPQRLLDRAGREGGVVDQHLQLVGVLHQGPHGRGVGRFGGVVAGRHHEDEPGEDLLVAQRVAVDVGEDQDARHVVGRVLPSGRHELHALLVHLRDVLGDERLEALGVQRRVAEAEQRVDRLRPRLVVLGVQPHELADHAGDDRLGDVGDEVGVLATLEAVHDARGDLADRGLVRGDRLRGERLLEEVLDAVVLRRVHADEHPLHQRDGDRLVGDDDVLRGGVPLPVATDGVDVLRPGHRPEPGVARRLLDARAPVHRALVAQTLEHLVGGALQPQLVVGDLQLREVLGCFGRHGVKRTVADIAGQDGRWRVARS
ncbi:unannotated protein [freshwater metagenome]|uniref:Unannotated protein n=1 Tax=freshwater metagenome TaxID=449393 RepID=A0A6J7JR44_9ZZZZ